MVDEDRESIQDKNAVAVIAFRESDIYVTDAAPGEAPQRDSADNRRGLSES